MIVCGYVGSNLVGIYLYHDDAILSFHKYFNKYIFYPHIIYYFLKKIQASSTQAQA